MSQHDYNIANQGFPNFRSDLNNALGAIATNNSGSTAPTTTFAHQWWLDTSTTPNTLRIRNADNDAWVVVGTVNQTDDTFVFTPAAGSASAPAYSVTGDTNTGIFFPAADTIAFGEGGAEAMRIDSNSRLLVGTSTSVAVDVINSKVQIEHTNYDASLTVKRNSNGDGGPLHIFVKSRGTSNGSNTVVQSGDTLGQLRFFGTDGTDPAEGASIIAQVDGTPGNNDMPGRLIFSTTADGSDSPTERMRINSSGNVGIGTTSPRAKLSVTNGTENTSGDAPQEVIFTGANQAITAGLGILTVQSNTAIAADVGATIALGGRIRNTGTSTDASNFAVLKGAKENATSDNSAGYFAISTKPNALAPVERMRITSTGRFCINTTYSDTQLNIAYDGGAIRGVDINNTISSNQDAIYFRTNGTNVGRINTDASNTSYVTSSDYRLKENVLPMTGALEKLAQLKPCTWTWKVNGAVGQGFIAHELQEVCPNAVVGEKDAIEIQRVEVSPAVEATYDEDGNELTPAVEAVYEEREVPKYQGVDTSFLVATLTAAIQELKAITDAQATRIEALEAEVAAMKAGNGN